MTYMCRICLQDAEEVVSLFSENENAKDILKKIYICTQIILEPDNELPGDICSICLNDLDSAYRFKTKCMTIHERFKIYREQIENIQDEILSKCSEDDTIDERSINEKNKEEMRANTKISQSEINGDGTFQCSVCTKVLKSMSSLTKHKETMHVKRKYAGKITGFGANRRFHCTTCSYSTPHSQTLTNHIRRHEGDRPYRCECGKGFTQTSSLAAHRKSHSSTTYYTCAQCGKQFKFAFALKTHLSVHENGKYSCHICNKVLKQKRTLKSHLQRHYKIYSYSCDQCGKTFITLPELISHRETHNTSETVECHICSYRTKTKKSLILHLKRHIGERPYRCNLCDTSCFTSSDLNRHQRKHTHEKPYTCPSCPQKFAYSSTLNKHMRTLHGVTYKWSDAKKKVQQNQIFGV